MDRENSLNAALLNMAFSSKFTLSSLLKWPLCPLPPLMHRTSCYLFIYFWKCLSVAQSTGVFSLSSELNFIYIPWQTSQFPQTADFWSFPLLPFSSAFSAPISVTQPCSCSHAFWKEDWPWGINWTPWGGNPVHMRQDRESSIPLPPFKNSQNPQGISHRDRTGWDRTGQYCWASGELRRCTRTSSSWFPHSGSPSAGMRTAM